MSPAHTSDFRTDDSQPPTLGQETLEGGCWGGKGGSGWLGLGKALPELLFVRWVTEVLLEVDRAAETCLLLEVSSGSALSWVPQCSLVGSFVNPSVLPRALPAFLRSCR